MTTTTNREEAERIAANRSIGVTGRAASTVIDGPGEGEYTVMTWGEAEADDFVMLCEGCMAGTDGGHLCGDSCDHCYRVACNCAVRS